MLLFIYFKTNTFAKKLTMLKMWNLHITSEFVCLLRHCIEGDFNLEGFQNPNQAYIIYFWKSGDTIPNVLLLPPSNDTEKTQDMWFECCYIQFKKPDGVHSVPKIPCIPRWCSAAIIKVLAEGFAIQIYKKILFRYFTWYIRHMHAAEKFVYREATKFSIIRHL